MGEQARGLGAALAKAGKPLPPWLLRPTLMPHLAAVWGAFLSLSSCRQVGMGLGPIPWTAMDRYATRMDLTDPDDFAEFEYLIRAMDTKYLEIVRDKEEEKPNRGRA